MDKDFLKKLKHKKRQTLRKEEADLQERQATLRQKREDLSAKREDIRDALIQCITDKNDDARKILDKQLDDIRNDLKEINEEYKSNSEALKCYSEVLRNKGERNSSILGTIFMGVGTGAAVWLGKSSLDKAYEANTEGNLVNKGPLDFFNKLNPLKMIGGGFGRKF